MNGDNLKIFKKFSLATALLSTLFLLLFTANYLTTPLSVKGLQAAAAQVLEVYGIKKPVMGDALQLTGAGAVFQKAFAVRDQSGKKGAAFIVSMTGQSGPVPGVFYYSKSSGVVFCGIAGTNAHFNRPLRYGISERVILRWQEKIEAAIAAAEIQL